MSARLLLIRHGESRWNVEGRIQGQQDVPLSERGVAQAEAIAHRLRGEPLAAVYSSPLRRALETAKAVARLHRLEVVPVPALAEIRHGTWEGLTEAEIAARDAERLRLWQRLPGRVRMPEGETLFEVRRRALTAVRSLAAKHDGHTIAIVTHDVVLKVVVAEVLGMDYDHLVRLEMANGGLTVVDHNGRDGRVVTLNDTAHL